MSPEDVQVANKDVKRCFKSLAVKDSKILVNNCQSA